MAMCMDRLAQLTQVSSHFWRASVKQDCPKMLHSPCRKAKQLQRVHRLCYGTSQSLKHLLPVNGKHKKVLAATFSSWLLISNSPSGLSRLDVTRFSAAFCLPFPCFPCEGALRHPLWHPRRLPLKLSAPNPCACSLACSLCLPLSPSQPQKSPCSPPWVQQGTNESACRDSGDKANGRSGEWQVLLSRVALTYPSGGT